VQGLIQRPIISESNFAKDPTSPVEEHIYLINIGGQECKLSCYQESTAEYIKQQGGRQLHLLALHSELVVCDSYHYDTLLLKWTETVAY
jgi:hypothetical protein